MTFDINDKVLDDILVSLREKEDILYTMLNKKIKDKNLSKEEIREERKIIKMNLFNIVVDRYMELNLFI